MRRARPLVFCVLALAFAFPALSQTPSTSAAFTTASCGKPVCTWNAFGPQTFTRENGKPAMLTASFAIRNPNTQYTMFVQNNGVASAVISLNGVQIFGPSNFNPNVATLQKSVSLQLSNTLTVELRSKPGANLTITVIGVDTDPPSIAYAENPFPNQYGWNNSNVTLTFSCADQTSGVASCSAPFTLTTEGLNQIVSGKAVDLAGNSTTVSVPVSIDKTPPTIRASVNPAPNTAGWNNTDVTVSFTCADTLSGIATCPSPVTVASEGAGQVVGGSAADRAGNTAQTTATINLDKTPPLIAISSPSSGANVTSPTLTVTGAASDSLSGLSAVTCNAAAAIVNAGSFSCDISLTSGVNNIVVGATDIAGNAATATLSVTYSSALNPPPTALFLTPDHFAMIISETRSLALVDDLGRAIPASNWTVSDPTVVQIAPDGAITALAAGKATVTGAYQNLTAAAELTVYAPQALKAGTVRWSVQPLPGNTLMKVYPGQPTGPDDPGVYFVEKSGSKLIVRALTADGRQKWVHTILPTLGTTPIRGSSSGSFSLQNISTAAPAPATIRPHRWGKQITEFLNQVNGQGTPSVASSTNGPRLRPAIFRTSASPGASLSEAGHQKGLLKQVQMGSSVTQTVLASATTDSGNEVLNTFEADTFHGCLSSRDNLIVLDASGNELWRHSIVCGEMGFALHPDGIVYILQADYGGATGVTLFAMDEVTGATKFSTQLPFSYGGQLQPFVGLPSVLPDGKLYLPVETAADGGSPDVLRLLKVAPDGTYSWTPVSTATQCYGPVIEPHEAIPDGQGGVLVTWDYFGSFTLCNGNRASVQLARMSAAGQVLAKQLLPLGRGLLPSYFSDNDGDALLGEQHFFITDGRQSAVGFNLSTSSIDLNWQTAPCASYPCPKVSLAGVAAGDQLIVNQTGNSDGSSKLFALTPSANSCPTACLTSTAASVPNATLLAFDFFIDPALRPFATFTLNNLYFFDVSGPAAPSAAGVMYLGNAAALAPDVIPTLKSPPPWPEVAMGGTRDRAISIKISDPQTIKDGETASFSVTVLGADPNDPPTYQWSFSAPKSAGNNPNVNFTDPTGASTKTDGHWFAFPNQECPNAPLTSTYDIKVDVTIANSKPKNKKSKLTVSLPAVAGRTSNPTLFGGPEVSFDDKRKLYFVSGSGTLTRLIPPPEINLPPSSQFYDKTVAHENQHVLQYTIGLNSDLYTVAGIMAVLSPLTDSTAAGLNSKILTAAQNFFRSQKLLVDSRRDAAEIDAYTVSDPISPRYAYQRCGVTHFLNP